MYIDRRILSNFDWLLFFLALSIPILGLIVLFSAGYDADIIKRSFHWVPDYLYSVPFLKQILFLLIGILLIGISLTIPFKFWHRYAYFFYAVGAFLVTMVHFFGVRAKGSQRWLRIPGVINLQPSELMKLGLILCLAKYLSSNLPERGGYKLKNLIIPFLLILYPMALIIKQPDLGTALSVGGVGFLMILFMGINFRTLAVMIILVLSLLYPVWNYFLHDYQKNRVLTLINPDLDPKGTGYHIAQSKIAVGSGGFLGKGFMKGTQTQLEFLPEHTTDFIFSVLGEEWGFLGCSFVILFYLFFLYRLLWTATKCKDLFASLVVVGVTSQIFFHAAINIGMVVGILPVVGIPLPLFSYGGSSVLSTMFAIGIVLGIGMRRMQFVGR